MGDQSLKVKREDFQETEKDWPEGWEESQMWASQGSEKRLQGGVTTMSNAERTSKRGLKLCPVGSPKE